MPLLTAVVDTNERLEVIVNSEVEAASDAATDAVGAQTSGAEQG